jgi:hypothetical protein
MVSENKFSKYLLYAIGEIALVIIGILIALQLNNVKENRKANKQEIKFLKSFKIDLEANHQELERVIEKSELVKIRANRILEYERGDINNETLAQLDTLVMNISDYTIFLSQDGTIEDIIGSGALNIIKNDSIRQAIASWNSNLKNMREYEDLSKKGTIQYLEYLRQTIDIYKASNQETILTEGTKEFLFKDRQFLNKVLQRSMSARTLNYLYKKEQPKIEKLISMINNEINYIEK